MRRSSRWTSVILVAACAGWAIAATAPARKAVRLSPADEMRLNAAIAQHRRVRMRLTPEEQGLLGHLVAHVKRQIFAMPTPDLLGAATLAVNRAIPGLSHAEATALGEYALGGVAGNDPLEIGSSGAGSQDQLMAATQQMQETQMSFDLQYLQLQSQMQDENRAYTAVSNIVRTKHDTVKNSIGNLR